MPRSAESRTAGPLPSNRATADFRSQNFRVERRRKFFRALVKHAYPKQTVPDLIVLTKQKYGERTIYDWIDGKTDAPFAVWVQLINEILAG